MTETFCLRVCQCLFIMVLCNVNAKKKYHTHSTGDVNKGTINEYESEKSDVNMS